MKHPVLTVFQKLAPKNTTLPQTGTSAIYPLPHPLPSSEKWKFGNFKLSWKFEVKLDFSIPRSSLLHPLPQKWKVGRFGTFMSSWASEIKVPLYPPLPHLGILLHISCFYGYRLCVETVCHVDINWQPRNLTAYLSVAAGIPRLTNMRTGLTASILLVRSLGLLR